MPDIYILGTPASDSLFLALAVFAVGFGICLGLGALFKRMERRKK